MADRIDGPPRAQLLAIARGSRQGPEGQADCSHVIETLAREFLREDDWIDSVNRKASSELARRLESALAIASQARSSSGNGEDRMAVAVALVVWPLVGIGVAGRADGYIFEESELRRVSGAGRIATWVGSVSDRAIACIGAGLSDQSVARLADRAGGHYRSRAKRIAAELVAHSVSLGSRPAAAAVAKLSGGASPPLEAIAQTGVEEEPTEAAASRPATSSV
ncbi:hypothetical protein [Botrimarina sp.]|uniref:hypothetical protein n=1 Tax=Botrimarina sp. TaxID=2795802 RepID=UPI0032EFA7D6